MKTGRDLVIEWCKERYPSMVSENDFCDLSVEDIFEFSEWVYNKYISEPFHECKYCGAMTNQPDENCYKAPKEKKLIFTCP